uniref:redoxin domain-containing protein n=1 Tax=Acetatifactor sp. TaxID=1872090 RepID=UPI004055D3C2
MKSKFLMILLATMLLVGCGTPGEADTKASIGAVEEDAGADEPYILSFEATTTDGESINSDCFAESKLTMINVWATYCNPCLSEMPDLGEIASSYDIADFQMLGIVSDVTNEADAADIEYAKELITETKANYPHLLLNESLYRNLVGGVEAVPTTFFVNQKSEVLGYVMGAQTKEVWEEIINGLLAEEQ